MTDRLSKAVKDLAEALEEYVEADGWDVIEWDMLRNCIEEVCDAAAKEKS
jgi:hypothetical protein